MSEPRIPSVSVKLDGKAFDNWTEVRVSSNVDALCTSVDLRWVLPGVGGDIGVSANSVLTLFADGQLITTVRPDVRHRKVTSKGHEWQMQARSLGRELVDCQYSATYSGLALGEIVTKLCEVFGVPVQIKGETQTVPEFAMQCEQPGNALLNAVRAANKLLYPTADGGLVLTDPDDLQLVGALRYGANIQSYTIVEEDRLRFGEYVVKASNALNDSSHVGKAGDDGINYFRPYHLVGDRLGNSDGACQRRAELERNRRLARAHRVEVVVPGWHYTDDAGNPALWQVNQLVRLILDGEQVDKPMLVGECHLSYSAQGRSTRLVLMPREAFEGRVDPPKGKRALLWRLEDL